MGKEERKIFSTAMGVRGVPTEPLVIYDTSGESGRRSGERGMGEIKLGNRKIVALAFADLALIAEDEEWSTMR